MGTNDEKVMFTSGLVDGTPVPAAIERIDSDGHVFKLRYGGITIPDGPGHGTLLVLDGVIIDWKLPNKQGHVPVDSDSLVERHITGQWRGPWGDWQFQ